MTDLNALAPLRIADPDTHLWVAGRVRLLTPAPTGERLALLARETIWALSVETGLARAVADGLLRLIGPADEAGLKTYIEQVRQATRTGPTLGRLLALHLPSVLLARPPLLDQFNRCLSVMRAKGTYTLGEPLEVLGELLDAGERDAADAYLDLLGTVFGQEISYNQSVRLVYVIPRSVRGFTARRRQAQIEALGRVAAADLQLTDSFLEGMSKGLALLAPPALATFMDQALALHGQAPNAVGAFLALSSKQGERACAQLQVAVPLSRIKARLDRYLAARLDRGVFVKPTSQLPRSAADPPVPWVCGDGRCIYLPDEIDGFPHAEENSAAAKALVRWEAGFCEFGTFAFDLERAADLYPEVTGQLAGRSITAPGPDRTDAQRFFDLFERPALAEDLFDLCEQARVLARAAQAYPGLVSRSLPLWREQVRQRCTQGLWTHLLAPLYDRLVLGLAPSEEAPAQAATLAHEAALRFADGMPPQSPVEACARVVCRIYGPYADALRAARRGYEPFVPPFGRRLRWDLVAAASAPQAAVARRIQVRLAEQGLHLYRSDLQETLVRQQDHISAEDIQTLVLTRHPPPAEGAAGAPIDLSRLDLAALLRAAGIDAGRAADSGGPAFYYPEWDVALQDYLHDHTRVQETVVPAAADGEFYRKALAQHRGLVARIRRAFEFLKPEGMVILRQWPEGDAFDHRALIDFAVERKAGRIPSDRLFIKRLKQERDVAALLLVDLSRSTANAVVGGHATVLDVAKEALVLFCEALQVVGDTYAIAGFSGTGRHSVDYFRVKNFDEPLGATVQGRIAGLRPQRSTRMGAAIRHATTQLAAVASRVRLLIVVSDGFPNDLGYKADYAIADTRRSVQEARTRGVHVKAITVNIGSDPRLDDLYGRMHHHVIGDVRELPDKLLRLYGTLTRRL
jgi:hypothetical protein